MFKLSIPGILGMLVVGLYSFVDAIFVGQWVGPEALGGISVAYPFTIINNALAVLIGMGSSSILSRAIGKKDKKLIEKIPGNLTVLILISSVIVTVLGTVFPEQIMELSGSSNMIKQYGANYLRIIFLGSFFVNFSQSANMLIRGEGKMKIAMLIMGIGAMLNIALDPIFIKVFNWGLEGAAYATVLSQFIQMIITFVYFSRFSKTLKLRNFRVDKPLTREVMTVESSGMMMQVMTIIQQLLIFNVIGRYSGSDETIIMGAVLRYMSFAFIPVWGMAQGFQPLVGTNYGAGKNDRVVKSLGIFCVASTVLTLIFWLPFVFANNSVLSMFVKDPVIIQEYSGRTLLFMAAYPIFGILVMAITLFQALGKAKIAGMLVMMRQILLFIPLVLILPLFFKSMGVWISFPVADVVVFMASLVIIRNSVKSLNSNMIREKAY